MMEEISLSITKSGNVYESERFRSICECVSVTVKATTGGSAETVCYRVMGFDESGREAVASEKTVTVGEDNRIRSEIQFDPVSLAVYQGLESFAVRLISDDLVSIDACSYCENVRFASLSHEAEERAAKRRGNPTPRKLHNVLFVGNSLLLGMENTYGMCSGSPEKDYFFHVSQAIKASSPDCKFYKVHGSDIEHSESMESFYDVLYTKPNVYTNRPFVESLTPDLDLVILQITDNVNTENKTKTFLESSELLLQEIQKRCPNAQIVWVYGWYLKRALFPRLWDLFDLYHVEPVNLLPLRMKANEAFAGMQYLSNDGSLKTVKNNWITHPGDLGMLAIANKIIETLSVIKVI